MITIGHTLIMNQFILKTVEEGEIRLKLEDPQNGRKENPGIELEDLFIVNSNFPTFFNRGVALRCQDER